MSDRHITDDEIHEASGHAPRLPTAVPKAICMLCGEEFPAFYACFSHDCQIELALQQSYAAWLLLFQDLGMGVLKTSTSAKWPFDQVVSGRDMLTEWLQSDLVIKHGLELRTDYYTSSRFLLAGFPE